MSNDENYKREDWERHYDANDLRWDLGEVSPPFIYLWEEKKINPCRMLIPGCGRGHEVLFFAQRGFDVTAIDFSKGAIERLNRSLDEKGLHAKVLYIDFFELQADYNEYYDLILEQTFFCAISPDDRSRYVDIVYRTLKNNGKLIALFYETGQAGGPPFNTTPDHVREKFSGKFHIESIEKTPHSAEQRKGKEWLVFLGKK